MEFLTGITSSLLPDKTLAFFFFIDKRQNPSFTFLLILEDGVETTGDAGTGGGSSLGGMGLGGGGGGGGDVLGDSSDEGAGNGDVGGGFRRVG